MRDENLEVKKSYRLIIDWFGILGTFSLKSMLNFKRSRIKVKLKWLIFENIREMCNLGLDYCFSTFELSQCSLKTLAIIEKKKVENEEDVVWEGNESCQTSRSESRSGFPGSSGVLLLFRLQFQTNSFSSWTSWKFSFVDIKTI